MSRTHSVAWAALWALVACGDGSPKSATKKAGADAGTSASVCDRCADQKCSHENAKCNGNPECVKITECVAQNSPCVGARSDDPLCDDDCIKAACALKYPKGVADYGAQQQCQSGAQCGTCNSVCTSETANMKCFVDNACDLAAPNPDDCKCSRFDAGTDAQTPAPSADAGQDCSMKPTCALVSADEVNQGLGKSLTGPVTQTHEQGGQTLLTCHYDPDQGAVNEAFSTQIIYYFPFSMADYATGRASQLSAPTDVPNLGDAAYTAPSVVNGGQYHLDVNTLIMLVGCVQVQIVSDASPDQLIQFAKKIVTKF